MGLPKASEVVLCTARRRDNVMVDKRDAVQRSEVFELATNETLERENGVRRADDFADS